MCRAPGLAGRNSGTIVARRPKSFSGSRHTFRCGIMILRGATMRTPRNMARAIGFFGTISIMVVSCVLAAAAGRALSSGARGGTTSLSASVEQEISRVVNEIDRIEAQTLAQLRDAPPDRAQRTALLGKLLMYDKQLSVNRNEACAFCHMPETGFTGPISELNATTVAYPGSVRSRFSQRKPQSHAYAPFSPPLHYNAGQGDFVGGNFWDMRATGLRLHNPAG